MVGERLDNGLGFPVLYHKPARRSVPCRPQEVRSMAKQTKKGAAQEKGGKGSKQQTGQAGK